MSIGSFK